MKRTIIIFLIFGGMFNQDIVSQEWAPIGATWYYNVGQPLLDSLYGYVKIVSEGDTLIEGKDCRVLSKTRIYNNNPVLLEDTLFLGYEYTREDSGIVYNYRHGQFYVLYDFTAQPGDSWVIHGSEFNVYHDTIGAVQVDSIGEAVVNNEPLRILYTSAVEGSDWWLGDMIIEKIGPINSFMLPLGTGSLYYLGLSGDSLRCYHDNTFGEYITGIAPQCDYTLGVDTYKGSENLFKAFPNPADNQITIVSESVFLKVIEVINIYGQVVQEIYPNVKKISLDISGFPSGVYFINIKQNNKTIKLKFIKK